MLNITSTGNHTITLAAMNSWGIRAPSSTTYSSIRKLPTVAASAAANPSPVAGTITDLSVLGADVAGESGLTYTWSVVGRRARHGQLQPNGTNAAKSTYATFSATGSYTLRATITNPAGLSITSPVTEPWSFCLLAGAIPTSARPASLARRGFEQWNLDDRGQRQRHLERIRPVQLRLANFQWRRLADWRVGSITNTGAAAKAGVMLRDSTDPSAMFADVVETPGDGVAFQWRSAPGAQPGQAIISGVTVPQWVELERVGNSFLGFYSGDGVNWTQLGSSQTVPMSSNALAGLAVTAVTNAQLNTATFSNVSWSSLAAPTLVQAATAVSPVDGVTANLTALATDQTGSSNLTYTWSVIGTPPGSVTFSGDGTNAAASTLATFSAPGVYNLHVTITDPAGMSVTSSLSETVNPLPAGWSDVDIGSPGVAGTASYGGGTWTVQGGGTDIWGTSDQFNFASQTSAATGILAQVTGVTNTDPWSKAGVCSATRRGQSELRRHRRDSRRRRQHAVARFGRVQPNYTQIPASRRRIGSSWSGTEITSRLLQSRRHPLDPGRQCRGYYERERPGRPGRHRAQQRLVQHRHVHQRIDRRQCRAADYRARRRRAQFCQPATPSISPSVQPTMACRRTHIQLDHASAHPRAVNFSVNGTNAAANTVATFTQAGVVSFPGHRHRPGRVEHDKRRHRGNASYGRFANLGGRQRRSFPGCR